LPVWSAMKIRCVVVGIDHWEDLTFPFLQGLVEHDPALDLVVIDNQSKEPYPKHAGFKTLRIPRVGYGSALNSGASGDWDWLLTLNNDCICSGEVSSIISSLSPNTVYGNEWKYDFNEADSGFPAVVDSAYMLIPRAIWDKVGGFDPLMDAAFEEIDYQFRVIRSGFRVDVSRLPIVHLNYHTRYELPGYSNRWHMTRAAFYKKYSFPS